MDNKSLIEYKPNLFTKLKQFFRNLFSKKEVVVEENSVPIKSHIEERNFTEEIKVNNIDLSNTVNNINKEFEREKFLNEIEGNREALNKLTIEQLKRLDKYYDTIIAENNLKIKKANG